MPIKSKKNKLEDYEPGATRKEVFEDLQKVANSPKTSQKPASQPAPTSK
jgi:hypothetical protein